MINNDINIRLFLYRLNTEFIDIAYIYEKIYAIDDYLFMRWVEYDYEEIPFFMDKYSIHGSAISMGTMQHIHIFPGQGNPAASKKLDLLCGRS